MIANNVVAFQQGLGLMTHAQANELCSLHTSHDNANDRDIASGCALRESCSSAASSQYNRDSHCRAT
eukprot:3966529-Amphidinium_carterae.1